MSSSDFPSLSNDIDLVKLLDNLLSNISGGTLNHKKIFDLGKFHSEQAGEIARLKAKLRALNKSVTSIRKLADMSGYHKQRADAADVFGTFELYGNVDVFIWDKPNGGVPVLDDDYLPDWKLVQTIIDGINGNYNSWIHGATGTGKDSAINFVAAKLNMPVVNISFDADISRSELVGRDKLSLGQNGNTISEFLEGLLPFALRNPVILVLDEIDFIREDVAYVMQTVLNEDRLTILEDKGRVVHKHPECRIFATANTNGVTDEMNLHVGARQQSAAFLDRFNNWGVAKYRECYLEFIHQLTGFNKADCENFNDVIKDYHKLFLIGDIRTPLSNRSIRTICEKAVQYEQSGAEVDEGFYLGIQSTLIARLNEYENERVSELVRKRMGTPANQAGLTGNNPTRITF